MPGSSTPESDEWPRRLRDHSFLLWLARSLAFPMTMSPCLGLTTPNVHATPFDSTDDRQLKQFNVLEWRHRSVDSLEYGTIFSM